MTTEHTETEIGNVRLIGCTFRGYNMDGSDPIQYTRNAAGEITCVDFAMEGWTCYGPTITREVGKSELDVLHKLAETYASDLVDERMDKSKDQIPAIKKVLASRQALMDALQSQAERIKELEATQYGSGRLQALRDERDNLLERLAASQKEELTLRTQLAALQSDDELPELPTLDPKMAIPYESIRYISGYAEVHVHQWMQDYARQAQAKVRAKMVPLEKDADMLWNHDDAERNHNSIDEFLNEEICNGMGVEVGGEFTMRRAISLPNIKIRVTSIDEEACEAEYEIIHSGITGEPK